MGEDDGEGWRLERDDRGLQTVSLVLEGNILALT